MMLRPILRACKNNPKAKPANRASSVAHAVIAAMVSSVPAALARRVTAARANRASLK